MRAELPKPLVCLVLCLALLPLSLCGGCEWQREEVFAVKLPPAPLHHTNVAGSGACGSGPGGLLANDGGARSSNTAQSRHSRTAGKQPKLDINEASATELVSVGLPPERAKAIVAGRPYRNKRELLQRGYLSPADYEHWKDRLVAHRSRQAGN